MTAILFAVGIEKIQSAEKHIIKSYEIQCIQISDESEHVIKKLDDKVEIKQLRDILSRAVYDEDMNDGRNIKMTAEEHAIKIIYCDDSRICTQLWDSLMCIDQV